MSTIAFFAAAFVLCGACCGTTLAIVFAMMGQVDAYRQDERDGGVDG